MRALALAGRRSEALHAYRECEALLQKELNVSPSPETTALFAAIESGRPL
jgi:DNA-binding SARP family transcriptional activator